MLHKIYGFLTDILALFAPFYLARRARRGKEDLERLQERYGHATQTRPDGKLIWIHAASVGEARSALSIIHLLLERNKDCFVLVTTGTVTSARILARDLPARAIHQYLPLDVKSWGEKFLDHWKPNVIVWIEQELWPNLLISIHNRKIPIFLVNAYLTRSSYKKWRLIRDFAHQLLRPFHSIYAKSETDGQMYAELSGRDVQVKGNLKYAALPLNYEHEKLDKLRKEIGERPIWIGASTHQGEEEILAQAHHLILQNIPDTLLLIAPRHPERGIQIANDLKFSPSNISLRSKGEKILPDTRVYIADSLGEMGLFYQLSPIVFVGGSLVPIGGHNLIEPAQQGCVTFYGPYMQKTEEVRDDFESIQAGFSLQAPKDIARLVQDLIKNPKKIEEIKTRTHQLIAKKRKILDHLAADIESVIK